MNTLPAALSNLLDEVDVDDTTILIRNVEWTAEKVTVTIDITADAYYRNERQSWSVTVDGVQDCVMFPGAASTFNVLQEHPLLWEFNRPGAQLYCSTRTGSPETAFTRVCLLHQKIFGDLIPLQRYLHQSSVVVEVFKCGYGLIASGPKTFLELMAATLQVENIVTSLVETKHSAGPGAANQLLLIDNSYVIGSRISFTDLHP